MTTIKWTRAKLRSFKTATNKAAREQGRDGVFTFEDNEFLVAYALYLVEFLEKRLK